MSEEEDTSEGMMDEEQCYEWGNLFNSDWASLVEGMAVRADAMGLVQEDSRPALIWREGDQERSRWIFVEDPSDITVIRDVYNSDKNVQSPACFVVVKQPDPSEQRGDVVFDIFRLNPQSYLWHFYRVYTPPS
jgi:hypothetical protein